MTYNSLILNREWRTRYSLTNFEDRFWIACLSYFLDPNMCGFQYICGVLWSPSDTKLQPPPFQHCLRMGNLDSDLDCLFIFRCKHRQLPDAQCHVNMACNQWLETWDVAIIYTGGTRICVTVQWMSVDCMTLSPAKLNLIWTAAVNSRVMTGESQTQCTSAELLCCKNTQLFNCIWQIMTHEWWIWIVLFILRCYQTSFSSGGCFCAFEILVALATKTDLGAVCTRGVWPNPSGQLAELIVYIIPPE